MKNFSKLFGIIAFVAVIVFSMVGCNMEDTGYQVEYYIITSSTYNNRPSNATHAETLNYVKNSSGVGKKSTYWCSNEQGLRDFFTEKLGYISNLDSMIQQINQQEVSAWWHIPGLLSTSRDYWFFYIENRN
jgi:uncharacterized lipoprotein YehR (DUF1307 family)